MDETVFWLKIIAAAGCGLIAGTFFAFSNFVMKALGSQPPPSGMAAMQSINVTVLNPLFLTVFVGTALLCLALAFLSLFRWQGTGSIWVLAGGLLYVLGCFAVTLLLNVPLNEALTKADPASAEDAAVWSNYLDRWTTWNTVRTAASLAASAAFMVAMRY